MHGNGFYNELGQIINMKMKQLLMLHDDGESIYMIRSAGTYVDYDIPGSESQP